MESRTVAVHPGLREADADGEASAVSREDLLALLREDPDVIVTLVPSPGPEPGRKGLAADIMLILGTPGALAAAVRIFQLWLRRDRDRYIRITQSVLDDTREIVIDAKDVSERAIESALRHFLDHE